MAQALVRGSTGPIANAGGNTTITWPAGTVAGDLAILRDTSTGDDPRGPKSDGWDYLDRHVWSKRVTATDLAGPVPVQGEVTALVTYYNAGGTDRMRAGAKVWSWANGASFHAGWLAPRHSSAIAASTYRLGSEVTNPATFFKHAIYARTTTTDRYLNPGSEHRSSAWISIEILGLQVPTTPTWLSPTAGSTVDRTQTVRLSWRHNSGSGIAQDKAKVIIRQVGTSTWYFVTAAGALTVTDTELVQSLESIDLAANTLAANTQYEAQVITHDDGGWSPWSASVQTIARTPPTVTVTLTTALDDLTPTVSWTTTPSYGTQTAWEIILADAAGTGPDAPLVVVPLTPGTQSSWTATVADVAPGGNLVFGPGQQIKALVRVRDSALPSAWTASTAQTVSWTAPPAVAAVTVTDARPVAVMVTGIPAESVRLSVDWETAPGVWKSVVPAIVGAVGSATIRVPHAPYGVARAYRVASWQVVDGVRVSSAYVTSTAVASSDTDPYVVSIDGTEWLRVGIPKGGDPEHTIVQGYAVSYGLARPSDTRTRVARVDRTPTAGETGKLTLVVHTDTELAALRDWVTGRDRWLMCWSPEYDDHGTLHPKTATAMSASGQTGIARRVEINAQLRSLTFDWVEQSKET